MPNSHSVLLCTVGGSHVPILRAIEAAKPDRVYFFCTERDPATGKEGSIRQITGTGSVIKAKPIDEKATLPNIPAQAQLEATQVETRIVPADDLDGATGVMLDAIRELRREHPNRQLIANYTGGTKTMTAALVCAALASDAVELQLVAGARPSLVGVVDGTERTVPASVARLRSQWAMRPHLEAWRRFAYREAVDGLRAVSTPVDSPEYHQLGFVLGLSDALARWDCFDHRGARDGLQQFGRRVSPMYPNLLPTLAQLTNDTNQREPARLFDLWLNAQRRAEQGRYDDAVARWYRLVEWTAQWQIKLQLGFETKDFPCDQMPDDVNGKVNDEGKCRVGLSDAWKIIAAKCKGACQEFGESEAKALRGHLDKRNHSILAHGFRAVSGDDWRELERWTQDRFLPMLREHAKQVGFHKQPEQLPTEPPEI